MNDDFMKRLWKGIADTDAQQDAADRIEALEAALAKADDLARAALECHPYVEELRCGDDLRAALTAYRDAQK